MNPTNAADITWLRNLLTTPGASYSPTTFPGTTPKSATPRSRTGRSSRTAPITSTFFTAGQLANLSASIVPASDPTRPITLAFDPDCDFYNDGVSFTIVTSSGVGGAAVPEPASLILLGIGLLISASHYGRRLKGAAK